MKTLTQTLTALTLGVLMASPAAAAMSRQEAVLAALDDEYRAFATYEAVMQAFGEIKPFVNIQRAESVHASMLKDYAKRNGIAVPQNTYLGANLPAAPGSVAEACKIGVQAEIDNAGLYSDRLLPAAKGDAELTAIFTKLMDDSQQKHLQAFQRCGGQQGAMGKGHGGGKGMRWGRS